MTTVTIRTRYFDGDVEHNIEANAENGAAAAGEIIVAKNHLNGNANNVGQTGTQVQTQQPQQTQQQPQQTQQQPQQTQQQPQQTQQQPQQTQQQPQQTQQQAVEIGLNDVLGPARELLQSQGEAALQEVLTAHGEANISQANPANYGALIQAINAKLGK